MSKPITVGILGGGQLGWLLAESLQRYGAGLVVYDPDPEAPLCQHIPQVFNGSWEDQALLQRFFAQCDVLTYEFENIPSAVLASCPIPVYPSQQVLEITQDRISEKKFLASAGLPHVPFQPYFCPREREQQADEIGYPLILKSAQGGYDGKGQSRVNQALDLPEFTGAGVIEEAIYLDLEASCIVARSLSGAEVVFGPFENCHKNHILDLTLYPARLSATVAEYLKDLALRAARKLQVIGLLTTEFMLTRTPPRNGEWVTIEGWYVLINEFAPRTHNTGHLTRNALSISQYDALAQILLGLPLGVPEPVAPGSFVMINLLGEVWLAQGRNELDLGSRQDFPEVVDVVIYGKKGITPRRKMGHFIVHAPDPDTAILRARAFHQRLMIQ